MTMKKMTKRLLSNYFDFMLAGDRERAMACADLLAVIKEKNLTELRGKVLDNL
jgi:hypothetical protein